MEASNVKAMREALRKITGLFRDIDLTIDCPENEAYAIAAKALASPPRNCDVGTAAEQDSRFSKFCGKQILCRNCPLFANSDKVECEFSFLQMPYEEGGEK